MRIPSLSAVAMLTLSATMISVPMALVAQSDEPAIFTQTLLRVDAKGSPIPTLDTTKIEINGKQTPLTALNPVRPSGLQIALLIDDGLRRSIGVQLADVASFLQGLPPGTEVLVGYMTNGTVRVAAPFSTDHTAAAAAIRLPFGIAGLSASPYFCLSEFVKHWPGNNENAEAGPQTGTKARVVMMITDGVDPYNGSTSILNQDSPYVLNAITDSQRAGVPVYSIYYGDAGIRGGRANFSGQSYLQQVAGATGGEAFYEGQFNPVSLVPYFKEFQRDIAETYVASFNASPDHEGHEHLVQLKVNSTIPKLKLRHADVVRPGNHESPAGQ